LVRHDQDVVAKHDNHNTDDIVANKSSMFPVETLVDIGHGSKTRRRVGTKKREERANMKDWFGRIRTPSS
jgi:hypothetical protein